MKLTILGNVPSKKNSRITTKSGRTFPSKLYAAWEKDALLQLALQWVGLRVAGYPISITMVFYYESLRRKDLDNSVSSVMDALVDAGILEDDSVAFVDCLTAQYGGHDKTSPRVEIFLDD